MRRLVQFAHKRPILFLALLALGIRLLGVLALDLKTGLLDTNFNTAAAGEQAAMARGLLETGEFTYFNIDLQPVPSAYQPPLYPALLAGLFAAVGDGKTAYIIVQLAQCLLGAWIVLLAFWLARKFIIERYALLAGVLAALWPPLVYMPNEAHPISLLVPAILLACICTVNAIRTQGRLVWFLWLGVSFAAGLMMRSEMLFALIAVVAALLIQLRGRAVAGAAIALAIGFAVQAPWMLRNASAIGKPALTTTAGLNLFRGNGPHATGGSYQWNGDIVWDTTQTLTAAKQLGWSKDYELKLDNIYSEALRDSLTDDPSRPLRLLPMKALFYWTSDFTHPKGKLPVAWLPWIMLLPAILYGMKVLWPQRREAWTLYFWPFFYFAIVLVLFALPRYRLNVEAIFLIFAAAGIGAWRERSTGQTIVAGYRSP